MNKKTGEIELFRFIFCIVIVCIHAKNLWGENLVFVGGAFAVEYFFLVSGYLMMASISKLEKHPIQNLGKETTHFLLKKLQSFYPEVVLSFIIGFLFIATALKMPPLKFANTLLQSIGEVLLLQATGLGTNSINPPIWYIQTMLLCMVILYPLCRKYPEMSKYIIFPVTGTFLLGYLYQVCVHLRGPDTWMGITFKGNIRGMAELCIGASCYPITQKLKELDLTKIGKFFLSAIKWLCWIVLIVYMWYVGSKYKQDVFMVALFMLAIMISFSHQGIDTNWFQNKFCFFLGKLSLPVYLNHFFYAKYLKYFLPKDSSYMRQFVYYLVCIGISSLLVMALCSLYRKKLPEIKSYMSALFLKDQTTTISE